MDTCLNNEITLNGAGMTASVCGSDNVTISFEKWNEQCLSINPTLILEGTTQIVCCSRQTAAPWGSNVRYNF
ncbi:MAG: hypothetical protein R2784_02185 [Saprospiraceae bacterium]